MSDTPARYLRALEHAARAAGSATALATLDAAAAAPYVSGLAPSPDDERDWPFVWSGRPALAEMDYRPQFSPVRNQGGKGACTAFQAVANAERLARLRGHDVDLSEEANYRISRAHISVGAGTAAPRCARRCTSARSSASAPKLCARTTTRT
jgi:hypothetical protein